MIRISDIMTADPVVISPERKISQAIQLMNVNKIGGLPVVKDNKLVGVITSRDLRAVDPNEQVRNLMTKEVVTVKPDTLLWRAQELLEENEIERLVVINHRNEVIGIITKTTLMAEYWRYWDPLTRLPRGEMMVKKGGEILEQGFEVSVIFFDMDNFGLIDKEHGHIQGDNILQQVAMLLRKKIVYDRDDFLCRYAGDEFAVISSRTLPEAIELAEEMIKGVKEYSWPEGMVVSCSAGVAGGRRKSIRTQRPDLTICQLINLASLASTRAKRENKPVVVAERLECGCIDKNSLEGNSQVNPFTILSSK